MATFQKITLLAGVPTLIVTGTGQRVLVQGSTFYLGASDVNIGYGIFISVGTLVNDYIDLGRVVNGETLYAISEFDNEISVLYYSTV